ncbi:protein trichome birefringence-like 37 [Spinacia oleracea]|uniref:Protein trichome birefringence-like 37 n=1 Tax=Spinacia oleracea TaxID=3562 RepID=A0ABM3REQ4_SPIOL|nr:protein trichome birefringence-like 37 [Spinacia oleracea]
MKSSWPVSDDKLTINTSEMNDLKAGAELLDIILPKSQRMGMEPQRAAVGKQNHSQVQLIYPAGSPPAADTVRRIIGTMKKPAYLLDITTLSQLRKDAHPETYSGDHSGIDCSNWYLPGLLASNLHLIRQSLLPYATSQPVFLTLLVLVNFF